MDTMTISYTRDQLIKLAQLFRDNDFSFHKALCFVPEIWDECSVSDVCMISYILEKFLKIKNGEEGVFPVREEIENGYRTSYEWEDEVRKILVN